MICSHCGEIIVSDDLYHARFEHGNIAIGAAMMLTAGALLYAATRLVLWFFGTL
jgi:hypothetical protein